MGVAYRCSPRPHCRNRVLNAIVPALIGIGLVALRTGRPRDALLVHRRRVIGAGTALMLGVYGGYGLDPSAPGSRVASYRRKAATATAAAASSERAAGVTPRVSFHAGSSAARQALRPRSKQAAPGCPVRP